MWARSLRGAALVCAISLFRLLCARHLPKRMLVLLWNAASLALLLPAALSFRGSVYGLLPGAGAESAAHLVPVWPLVYRWVCCTLLAGLAAMYLLGRMRLSRGRRAEHCEQIHDWYVRHPMLRPLRIVVGDGVRAPVCGGVLLPVIQMPEAMLSGSRTDLECALTHEYLHLCHFDPFWKLLYLICACRYWYLPPVWLVPILGGRDLEYACDEAVLDAGLCPGAYSRMLLRTQLLAQGHLTPDTGLALGQVGLRVKRIMRHRQYLPWRWLVAGALGLWILLTFATVPPTGGTPAYGSPAPEEPSLHLAVQWAGPTLLVPNAAGELLAVRPEQPASHAETDPYGNYRLLYSRSNVGSGEVDQAIAALRQEGLGCFIRVTEQNGEQTLYRVRVYDPPGDP